MEMMHSQKTGVERVLRGREGFTTHRHDEVLRMRWTGECVCLQGAPSLINLKGKCSVQFMGYCRLVDKKKKKKKCIEKPLG